MLSEAKHLVRKRPRQLPGTRCFAALNMTILQAFRQSKTPLSLTDLRTLPRLQGHNFYIDILAC